VSDPKNPHWSFCVSCSPDHVRRIEAEHAFAAFCAMRVLAADPRGRPHRRQM
jgi:hypothetical protein